MTRQIAPSSVLYRCDRKPLAETIVHSNGAVYTSLIDLTLYLLYMVRRGFFVLLDPPAKIQLKQVVKFVGKPQRLEFSSVFFFPPKCQPVVSIRTVLFYVMLQTCREKNNPPSRTTSLKLQHVDKVMPTVHFYIEITHLHPCSSITAMVVDLAGI
jgi:hypothetical protein